MLSALRRHSKSFIIYLMFAMIIVVFVFTFNTGMGRRGGCTSPEAPTYSIVGSHEITRDTLLMGMNLLPGFFRSPAGMSFALAAGMDLQAFMRNDLEELEPEQANAIMEALEMIYLASDEARRLGFTIGEKELAQAMYPESFYEEEEVQGEDGLPTTKKVFKQSEFTNWVTYGLHSSVQDYEEFVTDILLAFKLQEFLAGVVKVEPGEAEIAARAKGSKVDLEFVEFTPDMFEAMGKPTAEEINKFVAENEAEIGKYYDGHPTQFHTEPGFKVLGIFAAAVKPEEGKPEAEKAPTPPTPEQMEEAKSRIQKIKDRIEGKAELYPGGQLPIEVNPQAGTTLTIKPEQLKIPEAPLERFKEVAKRESDDKDTRDRSGLFFDWMGPAELKASLLGEKSAAALDKAKKDELVGPVEAVGGYWLIYVQDKRDKRDLTLEQAKGEIAGSLLKAKGAPVAAKAKAEEFLKLVQAEAAKADEKREWKDVVEEFKKGLTQGNEEADSALATLQVRKTGDFHLATPGKSVPLIGKFDELFTTAFKLTPDKALVEKVLVNPESNRAYVVRLHEKKSPADSIPAEELAAERESLSFLRDIPYFQAWLRALRQKTLEEGGMQRTDEFQSFLSYLQTRKQEAEERAAKKAGAAVPVVPPAATEPEPLEE